LRFRARHIASLLAVLGVWSVPASTLAAEAAAADAGGGPAAPINWPQFRGPGALPVSDNPRLPKTWSVTDNVEWVAEVPGMGWSSPIVWEGKVFLTTAVAPEMKQPSLGTDFSNEYVAELAKEGVAEADIEKKIYERDMEMPDEVELSYRLVSLDLETGKKLWDREFHAGNPPVGRHRKNSFTSETPVTDGKAVYVYVAHLGLWAFDFDGKKLWHTPLEPHKVYLDFGGGTSPALWKDRLFIQSDNEDVSFMAAFDTATGKEVWRADRTTLAAEGRRSGWSTPFVWNNSLRTEVVGVGSGFAVSYDLDGKELWRMAINSQAIPSPFAWNDTLYINAGAGGMPTRPLAAIKPGANGEIAIPKPADAAATAETGASEPAKAAAAPAESPASGSNDKLLWYDRTGGGTYLPTPVIYDGVIYVLTEKGILSAHDAKNGKQIYKSRVHPEARNFTASPWAYRDAVFMINEEGTTFVIEAGDEMKVAGINRLGEDEFVQATPAISGDRLLIRTQSKLYSIRQR
jgi:outer membrane protein assembly factor BamB